MRSRTCADARGRNIIEWESVVSVKSTLETFMKRFIFLCLGLAGLAAALLGAQDSPGISAARIEQHVRFLASPELKGRLTGTPECERAAQYVADAFKACGLQPAGDQGTYFQTYPFVAGTHPGPDNHLEIVEKSGAAPLIYKRDFQPMLFSDVGSAEGALVFAGYGITAPDLKYDDYEGVDVKDKIVLLLRFSPDGEKADSPFAGYDRLQDKAILAREKGAKAVLFVTGPLDHKEEELAEPGTQGMVANLRVLGLHLTQTAADAVLKGGGTSLAELQKAINAKRAPKSLDLPVVRLRVNVDLVQENKTARNVVGYLSAAGGGEDVVVVGAHFDHLGLGGEASRAEKKYGDIHPGADDNASGTAGVMELARVITAQKPVLKRGIVFIGFSGEELGLLGSDYYVRHPFKSMKQTAAMINMDMIGRLKDNILVANASDTSPQWDPMLDRINADYKFDLKKNPGGFAASDNTSFYKEDVPVLFFFTNLHDDYHKPSDTADKINYAGEARLLGLVEEAVVATASAPERPVFTKSKVAAGGTRGAMRVYTGTIPDFASQTDGYRISGVQPGSPAEKAGLKKDDTITGVGAMTIHSIYDYMAAFKTMKPGDKVEFRYARGGKESKTVVELAPSKSTDK